MYLLLSIQSSNYSLSKGMFLLCCLQALWSWLRMGNPGDTSWPRTTLHSHLGKQHHFMYLYLHIIYIQVSLWGVQILSHRGKHLDLSRKQPFPTAMCREKARLIHKHCSQVTSLKLKKNLTSVNAKTETT